MNNTGVYTGPVIVGLCGVVLAAVVFALTVQVERSNASDAFGYAVSDQHGQLQRALTHAEEHLRHLRRFFYSSNKVTRNEFHRYTSSFISQHEEVHWNGIYWIPAQAPDEAADTFEDRRLSSKRTVSIGSSKAALFPVLYQREVAGDRMTRGTNLVDEASLRSLIKTCIRSGSMKALTPVGEADPDSSIEHPWMFYPVYEEPDAGPETPLQGFVASCIDLSKTFAPLIDRSAHHLTIRHGPTDAEPAVDKEDDTGQAVSGYSSLMSRYRTLLYGSFRQTRPLWLANQSWTVTYTPKSGFFRVLDPWLPPVASGMVLLLTLLLVGYLHTVNSREEVIRETVDERTEELRKAKEREAEASRAKSEFLARMSHEIRTPLNAIMGMNELIQQTSLTPEQDEYIQISQQSAETLLNLINDLLELSSIDAGDLELDPHAFKLEPFVRETVSYFAREAFGKGIDLHVFVDGNCPAYVVQDRQRLRQVLVNLLSNAVKYTDEGEVVVRVLRDERDPPEQWLLFRVVDTGIGIPKDQRDELFEKFTQVSSDNSEKEGTGLGLSICKSLVDRMGGEIDVESEEGRGSTFTVRVPVQLPDDRPSEETVGQLVSDELTPELSGLNVLLVDNSSTNRLILGRMLNRLDARVSEANTGEEALEALREAGEQDETFDLVLVDRHLRGEDALDVIDKLEEHMDSDRLILMIRSGERPGDRSEIDQVDVGDVLVKPIDWSSLVESMKHILVPEQGDVRTDTPDEVEGKQDLELDRRCSILVAEDNRHNRRLIGAMLESYPFNLEFAEDGREALEMARSGSYDLMFMDIRMPDMDGLEVTRRYREWERQEDRDRVPIVALTARALAEHRRESKQAGCDGHLTKPISERKLIETTRRFVHSEHDASSSGGSEESSTENEGVEGASDHPERTLDERYQEFVPELLSDIRDKMNRIRDAAGRNEYEQVNDVAHDVKGAAANFGLHRIQETARRMEDLARREADPDELQSLAERVISYLDALEITYE